MQNELQNIFDEDVEKYGIAKAHNGEQKEKNYHYGYLTMKVRFMTTQFQ